MQALIISLIFGGVIALIVWNITQLFNAVPDEDRSFLDRPPLGFRLVWPLVQTIVHYFGGLISENYQYATHMRLKRAGVEFSLSPEQFFAGKILGAVFAGLLAFLVMFMLGKGSFIFILLIMIGGFFYPELWLKETTDKRNRDIFRALPFYLDIITLAVEAGSNLTGGLTQAVQKAPEGPLRYEISRVLRDIRAGMTRADALRSLTDRVSSQGIANVVSSMIQAEKTGSSLGPILRAQAEQLRNARFLKAEKMAMEAPVKLLGPLIMFIFPTTFLVLGFVILSEAIQQGVLTWKPMVWAFYWPG